MNPDVIVALLALVAPIGGYLLAAKRMSGKIGTSDAAELWAESKAIRDWSSQRLEDCNKEIESLRKAYSDLSSRCTDLEKRLTEANEQLAAIGSGKGAT